MPLVTQVMALGDPEGGEVLQSGRGELKICAAGPDVRAMLETAQFDSLIRMYDTEKDAVAAFTTARAAISPLTNRRPLPGHPKARLPVERPVFRPPDRLLAGRDDALS